MGDIRRTARYFAWGILFAPVGLVLTWLVIRYVPFLAELLHSFFTNALGKIDAFSVAAEAMNSFISASEFSFADYLLNFFVILFSALSDSLIIGCSIFFVKSLYTMTTNKGRGRFTKPVWLLVLGGLVLGVVMCSIKSVLAAKAQAILMLVTCLACYIGGMALMLGQFRSGWGSTYRNRWAGFLIEMLLGIVGDVLDALCGVMIATALMAGAYATKEGGSPTLCILLIIISALLVFLKNLLMDALRPNAD